MTIVDDIVIIFFENYARGVHHPHCDALDITLFVASKLHLILMNNGSSVEILFLSTFVQVGLERSQLKPYTATLDEFTKGSVVPNGVIELVVSLENV